MASRVKGHVPTSYFLLLETSSLFPNNPQQRETLQIRNFSSSLGLLAPNSVFIVYPFPVNNVLRDLARGFLSLFFLTMLTPF